MKKGGYFGRRLVNLLHYYSREQHYRDIAPLSGSGDLHGSTVALGTGLVGESCLSERGLNLNEAQHKDINSAGATEAQDGCRQGLGAA